MRLSKIKLAQQLAEQLLPDNAQMSRQVLLLARVGATQMMADAVVGHDLAVWTKDQIVEKMKNKMVLWSNSIK